MTSFFGNPDWWKRGNNQDRYTNGEWLKKRK